MPFLAFLAGCALSCAGQTPADPAPPQSAVSVERIVQRLQRPAVLQLPVEGEADFRAEVEEVARPETILEALRRELAGDVTSKRIVPGTTAPPLVTVELLQLVANVRRRLSGALRARAERNARTEVEAALREFCAQHDCSVLEQSLPRSGDGDGRKPSDLEGVLTHRW